ncbi:unnamed protein product, partial [Symbiodinium pilosum]
VLRYATSWRCALTTDADDSAICKALIARVPAPRGPTVAAEPALPHASYAFARLCRGWGGGTRRGLAEEAAAK